MSKPEIKPFSTSLNTVTTSSGARFVIEMRLIESKKQYGRVDWLCVPVSGEGEVWLNEGSLKMRPEGETE